MKNKIIASFLVATALALNVGFADADNTQIDSIKVAPQEQMQMQLSFAPLVKKAAPAVVNVYAARRVQTASPFAGDPFFEQFFGRNRSPRKQSSLGSGVIVDESGLIVTNFHVIRGADEIKVALSDGREFESKIMLTDEATDIAILKIEPKGAPFPVLTLGNSDAVEVGDIVLAIGNPFGVGQTVTSGIVSAQARTRVGISDFDFFIQTDAAINPGNSGGALVDMKGQLIGINTAIYSRSGGSVGIGFAIPANLVRTVVQAVINGGNSFEPPYIGASFQDITPLMADGLGMNRPYGVLVTEVVKASPADKAGLKVGDVIVSLNGQTVDNLDGFGYRLMTAASGKAIAVNYLRDGKAMTTSIAVEAVSPSELGTPETIKTEGPFAGAKVLELTPQNSRRYRVPLSVKGVVIDETEQNSPAAYLFQRGDVLRTVNGVEIKTIADLKKVLAAKDPKFWQLEYVRNGVLVRQLIR